MLKLYKLVIIIILIFAQKSIFSQTPLLIENSATENFIGEDFCFDINVENNSGIVGYQPYLRVVLPQNISYNSLSFNTGSGTIVLNELFTSTGTITDPLTEEEVLGTSGDRLIIYELPIGSLVQNGPNLMVEFCGSILNAATVGIAESIDFTPIFRFGNDPTGGEPIIGAVETAIITPILYRFRKEVATFEGHRPPGPSFPLTYRLIVDIANGETITNLNFSDILPSELQFVGMESISGGSGGNFSSLPSVSTPGGTINATLNSATGTTADSDVVVEYTAYIRDILGHDFCDTKNILNSANFDANYNSTPQPTSQDAIPVLAKHSTIEKFTVNGENRVPGQTVNFNINFQISDYDNIDDLTILDNVPDGLNTPSTSSFSLTVGGSSFPVTPIINSNPSTGISTIELLLHTLPGIDLNGATSGTLSYSTTIRQFYVSTGLAVLANDTMSGAASLIYGTEEGASGCTDNTSSSVRIINVSVEKEIVSQATDYNPGDIITYRLTMDLPSGDSKEIIMTDYFPLPVLNMTDFTPVWGTNIRYANSSFITGSPPNITKQNSTNSLSFYWDYIFTSMPGNLVIEVDIPIATIPFADGLFHSNVLEGMTENSGNISSTQNTSVLIQIDAPEMTIEKNIVASDQGSISQGNLTNADASDEITFVLTLENVGGASAFDVLIQEDMPDDFINCTLNSVTTGNGSTAVTSSGNLFTAGMTLNNEVLSAEDAGNTMANIVLINYTCQLDTDVFPNIELINEASLTYSSEVGQIPFPTEMDNASVQTLSPSISKRKLSIDPNYSGNLNDVQIGEIITYEVEVEIPEGLSPNSFITDVLESGLSFVDIVSISFSPDLSTDLSGGFNSITSTSIAGLSNINIPLGNITNSNTNNNNNSTETIVIVYRAEVLNLASNTDGRRLRNRARLSVNNTVYTTPRVRVDVIDADLDITFGINSTDNPNATLTDPSSTPVNSNLIDVQADDEVEFVITLSNTGNGAALDVNINEPSVDGLENCAIINVVDENGVAVDYTGDLFAGGINLTNPMPANSQVFVTHTCELESDVLPAEILDIEATATYDPEPGSTTPISVSDPASIVILNVQIAKNALAIEPNYSGNLTEATIGEVITYGVDITIPQGGMSLVSFIDQLPEGLAFVEVVSVTASPTITSSVGGGFLGMPQSAIISAEGAGVSNLDRNLRIDFGNLSNSDTDNSTQEVITVIYKVAVLNTSSNTTGTSLENNAQIEWGNPNGGSVPSSANSQYSIQIVEPELTVTKSFATNPAFNTDNNFVNLQIDHTTLSSSIAHDIVVEDILPAGMIYLANTLNSTCPDRQLEFIPDPTLLTGGTIRATFPTLQVWQDCLVNFEFQTDPIAGVCEPLTNCSEVYYESLSESIESTLPNPPNNTLRVERTGNTGDAGELNNYTNQGCEDLLILNELIVLPSITGNTPACEGETFTVTETSNFNGAALIYEWTGPNGAIANNNASLVIDPVSPADEGDYFVEVTVDGCPLGISNTFSLEVYPRPATPVTSSGGPYCEGENIFLFASNGAVGSTWLWSGPNGFNSTAQNPIITDAQTFHAGDYSVQIIDANGCASLASNAVNVVVRPTPATLTITNSGPVCGEGMNDIILNAANVDAGGIVDWYDSNGLLIGTGNPLTLNNVMMVAEGDYYAVVTLNGCPSLPSNITTLFINDLPSDNAFAGNDENYCIGTTSISLNATEPSIGSGMWTQISGTNATIVSPNNASSQLTGLTTGNYTFRWSLSNGVCVDYSIDDINISISNQLSAPIATNNGPVCVGADLQLIATGGDIGDSYLWIGPNGFSSTIQNPLISPITSLSAGDYQVKRITNNGCESEFSAITTVIINNTAETPLIYSNSPLCSSEVLELFTSSVGAIYEWYGPDGGNPTVTTTTSTLNVDASDSYYINGEWRVKVITNDNCNSELSSPIEVTINNTPSSPSVSSVTGTCEGVDFQLSAATIPNAIYNWTGPDGFSSNEQNPIITNPTNANTGNYQVTATVSGCTSLPTILSISINANPTTVPTNNGGACGSNLELFANAAEGQAPYSYTWTGPNNFSSFDENPIIVSPNASHEGSYSLQIMDANGCVSAPVVTQVALISGGTFQPVITSNTPVCIGEVLSISTTQFNGTNVTYEWTGPNGTSTSNGDYPNAPIVNISTVNTANAGDYSVLVTVDGCSSNSSSSHTVAVNSLPEANPTASTLQGCVSGVEDITLQTNPINGAVPYNFIWNGPNGFSSMVQNPILNNVNASFSGVYEVIVTDANGCSSLDHTLVLDLNDRPELPIISGELDICSGDRLEVSIQNYQGTQVEYFWVFNNNNLNQNSNVLTINPITPSQAGVYSVFVMVDNCPSETLTFDVTITDGLSVILSDQSFDCIPQNTSITINSAVSGGVLPYNYQWTGPNNYTSTQANPTLVNASNEDAGVYTLLVSDNGGNCPEQLVSSVVSISEQPEVPQIQGNNAYCSGDKATLSIQEYNGTNVSYNWTYNGNQLSNNSNILTIDDISTNEAGTYAVSVTVNGCTSVVSDIIISVNENLVVTLQNQALSCVNNTTDLNLSAEVNGGTSPYSYSWTGPNSFSSSQVEPTIPNATAANAGTYSLVVTDGLGCISNIISSVVTISEGLDQPTITSTGTVCENGAITLSVANYTGSNVSYNWSFDGAAIANNSNVLELNSVTENSAGNYQVVVTVDGCSSASELFVLEVLDNPEILLTTPKPLVCTDGTVNDTIIAMVTGGNNSYIYSWTGPNNYTSSSQNAIIFGATSADAGNYSLVVTDTNGCQSEIASVEVEITEGINSAIILGQPSICEGGELVLSIDGIFNGSTTYSWTHNGNVISTSNELIIPNATPTNSGDYQVVIENSGCITTTNIFTAEVTEQPIVEAITPAPFECANGTNDLLIDGSPLSSHPPFSFSWTGPNGYSATDEDATIINAEEVDAGVYTVVLTDGNGCVSNPVSVNVDITSGADQPIITSSGPACEGASITLSSQAYSGGSVFYDWEKDGQSLNNNSNVLTLNPVSSSDAGQYILTATLDGCVVASNPFNQSVYESPEVTIAQVPFFACTDSTLDYTLDATASGGDGNYTYLWTGPNGFLSTLEDAEIQNIDESKAGTYTVVITDGNNCSSAAASVVIQVSDGVSVPQITSSGPTCTGGTTTLFVQEYTGASVVYDWRKDGVSFNNPSNQLILNPVTLADIGVYTVSVAVDGCTSLSEEYTLETYGNPEVEIQDVLSQECVDGSTSMTLNSIVSGGSGVYSYTWSGPDGFASSLPNPEINNITSANEGTYSLSITDDNGCQAEIASIQIFVSDLPAQPVITSTGAVCEGGEFTLTAPAYAGGSTTYIWSHNGNPINNNSNILTINPATFADAGDYDLSVFASGCLVVANTFTQEVYEEPEVTIAPIPSFVCTDGTEDLTLNATANLGSGNYTYSWTGPNGFTSSLEDPSIQNIDESKAGTYTVVVMDASNCSSPAASIELQVEDGITEPQITSSGATCEGGIVTLSVETYTGSNVTYDWTKDGIAINNASNILTLNPVDLTDEAIYAVTVNVDGCSSTSEDLELDIFENPSITIENVLPQTCVDGTSNITLNSTATGGSGIYTYAWSGPNGFTSSLEDLTLSNITSADAGTYSVTLTDDNGCLGEVASTEVVITDGLSQPVIVSTGTVCEGGIVTLSVETYTGANVTYNWIKDGIAINNASNILTLNPVDLTDEAIYAVTVNEDGCSSTSENLELDIFENPIVMIDAIPVFACTDGTEDLILNATATNGDGIYTYSWTGPNGFISTLEDPELLNISSNDAGTYTVIITDGNNCTSDAASVELQVQEGIETPQIISSGATCEGGEITLSIQQYVGTNIEYQWTKDGNVLTINSNELQFNPVTPSDEGTYEVTVTVNGCSAISTAFALEVFANPSISIENVLPQTCVNGTSSIILNSTATGGSSVYSYAWSGPNGFTSSLEDPTLSNITSVDAGTYSVTLTDNNGCLGEVASTEVVITDAPNQPIITSSGAVCEGGTVTLFAQNYAGANVIYQWRRNAVLLPISSNELTLNPVSVSDAGTYVLTVIVDGCSTMSAPYDLEIFASPVLNFVENSGPIICANGMQDLTLFASGVGSGEMVFAWTGPNGFTSNEGTPTINMANSTHSGTYTLVISNEFGCESNMGSTLVNITDIPSQPVITSSGPTCEGNSVTLSVESYAGSEVSYHWTLDGAVIINNSNQLIISPVSVNNAGDYAVSIHVDECIVTSDDYKLDVYENPSVVLDNTAQVDCATGAEQLVLNATPSGGDGNYEYEWTGPNTYFSTSQNAVLSNITSDDSGIYTLTITDGNNCESSTENTLVNISDMPAQPVITNTGATCEGGSILLSIDNYVGSSVTYEWFKNGISIGNNNTQLAFNPATVSDFGNYSVTVTVGDCDATAEEIVVEVFEKPIVEINPVPPFACTDGTEILELNATIIGAGGYSYAWTGPNNFTSSAASPSISNITSANTGTYTLVVTDANNCIANSASIEVVIFDNIATPQITGSGPACAGGEVTLSIQGYSGNNVSYNWTKDGQTLNINNNQIILNPVTASDAGQYAVTVMVNDCAETSAPFDVVVYDRPNASAALIAPIECTDGTQSVTLSLDVTGSTDYTVSWTGPNDFVSTLEDPTLNNITSNQSGTYIAIITNENDCTSDAVSVELSITDALEQPVITSSGAACEGDEIIISIQEYNGTNVNYEWRLDGNVLATNAHEIIISSASVSHAGDYSVMVTRTGCSAISSLFTQEVFALPVVSIDAVSALECTSGTEDILLNSSVIGVGDFTYSWTGSNDFVSTLEDPTLSNVSSEFSGTYQLIVTSENGCSSDAVSAEISITDAQIQPLITSSGPVCEGESLILEIPSYTGTNVLYEWSLNGNTLINNSNQLILNPATPDFSGDYQVTVTVDGCSATSEYYNQMVFEKTTVSILEVPAVECTNGLMDLNLNVTATGFTPIAYSWTGPNGFSSTFEDPTLSNVSSELSGTYIVEITDGNGCVSTPASVEISITDSPVQPLITSTGPTCEGGMVTLSIDEYIGVNVIYEWRLNGILLPVNNNELIINAANLNDAGDYQVSVITDGCTVFSPIYNLVINERPVVNILDVPEVLCADGTEVMTIEAEINGGAPNYDYLWTMPNGLTTTQDVIILTNLNSSYAGIYTLEITDNNNCTSAIASEDVVITDGLFQPFIFSNAPGCNGETVTMSISEYPGNNVEYVWTLNGQELSNNSNELIIATTTIDNIGDYQVTVSSDGCSSTSPIYNLTIFEAPQVSISDVPPTICTAGDEEVVLDANITGGLAPFSFEWIGPNDFFSVNEDPVLINVDATFSGSYTVYVTDANGCAGNPFTIEIDVKDAIIEPIITSNAPVCEGEQAILEVQEYEGVEVEYEWFKNGVSLGVLTSNEWIINPATPEDNGSYTVAISVDGCENLSDPYELTIHPKPVVTIADVGELTCTNSFDEITLNATVTTSGTTSTFDYAWTGPNNFTSSNEDPVLVNVTNEYSGTYTVIVTDENGCVSLPTSVEIDITNSIAQPIITSNASVCEGEQVLMEILEYAGTDVSYDWYKNGVLIQGENSHQIIISPASISDAASYMASVSVDGCESLSDSYELTIHAKPEVSIADIGELTCTNSFDEITLNATATTAGTASIFDYAWTGPNDFVSSNEDPVLVNVTNEYSGTYTVIVTDENGCVSLPTSVEIDITNSIAQPIITSNASVCEGEQVLMEILEYAGTDVSYDWYKNGVLIQGENSHQIIISPAAISDDASYSVTVYVDGCENTSEDYTLEIFIQPMATIDVVTPLPCTDGSQEFILNATVIGSFDYTYSWTGPNGFVSNNEDPVLVNVTSEDSGTYSFTATDGNGCTSIPTSVEIDITDAIDEPVISTSGPACLGEEIILDVPQYTGTNVSYTWVHNGQVIPGNGNELLLNPVSIEDAGEYSVTIVSDDCSTIAAPIIVELYNSPVIDPTATTDDICHGASLSLFANVVFELNLSFSWSGPNGFTSSLPNPVINDVSVLNNGEYILSISNGFGCVTTQSVIVENILPQALQPTIISNSPICEGEDLILETGANGVVFEWIGALGNSESTLAIEGLTTTEGITTLSADHPAYLAGDWAVRVQDENGCWAEISESIEVTINSIPTAIATNGGEICEGGNAQLFANAIANANYEWRIAGTSEIISTQQNPVISNQLETTTYELTINANGCISETTTTTVEVRPAPQSVPFTSYSLNSDCSPSDLQLFTNPTINQEIESYAWTGPNGFTSNVANPAIANATEANNGIYEVTITDFLGCSATYATAPVNVIPDAVPEPIIEHSGPACQGGTITLSVPQYSGSSVEYVWSMNGTNITGQNTNQLVMSPVGSENEGTYSVSITVDGCTLTSDEYTLDVFDQPIVQPLHLLSNFCEGGYMQLFANVSNYEGELSYQWTGPNNFTSNADNPLINAVTAEDNGSYTVTVTTESGCQASATVTVIEITAPPATPTIITEGEVCEGEDFTLAAQSQNYPFGTEFIWFNGLGEQIGNGNILTLNANDANAISPYTLQASRFFCLSEISEAVSVNVVEIPTATATNNGPICGNETVQLVAGDVADASFEWRILGEETIISTSQNPQIFNLTATTTYELTVISEGCASQNTAQTTVEVNPTPEITSISALSDGSEGSFCQGSNITLSATNGNPNVGQMTYIWTGPNDFEYSGFATAESDFAVTLPNVDTSMEGTYQLELVPLNGCPSVTLSVLLDLDAIPQTPQIALEEDFLCEGQTIELNATSYTGTTVSYEWHFINEAEEDFILNITTTPTLILAGAAPSNNGSYYVVATVNGCTSGPSNLEVLTVYGSATMPEISNSTSEENPVCEEGVVQLNAPFYEGATYQWFGPNGFNSDLFAPVISPATMANAGDYFSVITFNGCSSVTSTTTTVYVSPIPTAPTIMASEAVCEGGNVTLSVSSPLNTEVDDVLTFEWYYAATNALVATTNEPAFVLDNTTANQAGEYYVVYTLNGCVADASATTFVDITALPTQIADAGVSETICAATNYDLQAVPALQGAGMWTSLQGASILDPTEANTQVFNLQEGDNIFVWTLSSGACEDYSADTVTINVSVIPVDEANAGLDQNLCGTTSANLAASTPTQATGQWSQPTAQEGAGIVIVEPTNPNTSITGMETDQTYTFIWSLTEGICDNYDVDTTYISTNGELSSQAYIDTETIFACGAEDLIITAETPLEGVGIWTTSGGALIVEPTNPETIIADFDAGENTFYWTLSNGACESYSTDSITIYNDLPLLANDDYYNVSFNDSLTNQNAMTNDLTFDVLNWEYTIIRRPGHGLIEDFGNGEFNYTPNENYFGEDFFMYSLCNLNCPDMCDTATVFLTISGQDAEGDCFTPNLITPNGDNMNDALMFPCLDEYPDNHIMIFNRWGDKVYETIRYENDWEGTYKGNELPAGTYFFILILDEQSKPIQKYFTLVR